MLRKENALALISQTIVESPVHSETDQRLVAVGDGRQQQIGNWKLAIENFQQHSVLAHMVLQELGLQGRHGYQVSGTKFLRPGSRVTFCALCCVSPGRPHSLFSGYLQVQT